MYVSGLGAVSVTDRFTKNLFAPNTEGLNDQRIAMNAALEQKALTGDIAALAQLQLRATPGVLPYIVATNDAKVRVANVKAMRGNLTQSGGGNTLVSSGTGVPIVSSQPASGLTKGVLGAAGLITVAILLRGRL